MSNDERRRHFTGLADELNLRTGEGKQEFLRKEGNETYLGPFKRDIYHGQGDYIAHTIFRDPWAYEGKFVANSLEGYGTMSFADNKTFSGLYKNNRAFGPGVLTYPNGTQDVGMWSGSPIIRLCSTVGSVESLSKTPRDRIQVTKYKTLVNINSQKQDIATEIMQKISSDPKLLSQAYKLYSKHCKNPESLLFDNRYFNDDFCDLRNVRDDLFQLKEKLSINWKPSIDTDIVKSIAKPRGIVEENKEENTESAETVLVAWNNEPIMIDMMKHTFCYRKQECSTHLNFSNVLCNRRKCFGDPGDKEKSSIEMLLASERNDVKQMLELLRNFYLNVDVMDNKGNSMILLAASRDAHETIQILSEVYCDINAVNDEGFSALNHTLTRYLALLYGIKNWANGFMPPLDEGDLTDASGLRWLEECMRGSVPSLSSPNSPRYTEGGLNDEDSLYLFNLRLKRKRSYESTTHSSRGIKRHSLNKNHSVRRTTSHTRNPKDFLKKVGDTIIKQKLQEKFEKQKKLSTIEETISLLLDIGADVDASVTPAPVWVMALFAGNIRIIEGLLKHGVDPNKEITIDRGSLTPLHVIVLAKPLRTFPRIADLLIQYGANPHIRTDADYWTELWEFLRDFRGPPRLKEGMNPLHALILRPEPDTSEEKKYLEDVGCILSWNTMETEMFYGLTPLALAIAKGNWSLMKVLLKCSKVLVNKKFDDFWGNPLTTLMRAHGTSSDPKSYRMLEYMLQYGADPLEMNVTTYGGNVINFVSDLKEKMFGSREDSETQSITKSKKMDREQSDDKRKLRAFEAKEALLKDIAKNRVERHIKGVLARTVINCMQKNQTDSSKTTDTFANTLNHIDKWVTFEELPDLFSDNLQISEISNGMALVNGMLVFPELFPRPMPVTNRKEKRRVVNKNKQMEETEKHEMNSTSNIKSDDFDDKQTLESWEFKFKGKLDDVKEIARLHNYNTKIPPEIDKNEHPYTVCYDCLKKSSNCLPCPSCGLVNFCSLECNLKDAKNPKSKHTCKLVYWGLDPEDWYVHKHLSESLRKSKLLISKTGQILGVESKQIPEQEPTEDEEESKKNRSLKTRFSMSISDHKQSVVTEKVNEINRSLDIINIGDVNEVAKSTISLRRTLISAKHSKKSSYGMGGKSSYGMDRKSGYGIGRKRGYGVKSIKAKYISKGKVKAKGPVVRHDKIGMVKSDKDLEVLQNIKYRLVSRPEELCKRTICPEIDYNILGGKASQEKLWDQSEETKYNLQERLAAYLKALYDFFGDSFDIDNFFPFVTFRHGNLYYKYYKQLPLNEEIIIENYSFN